MLCVLRCAGVTMTVAHYQRRRRPWLRCAASRMALQACDRGGVWSLEWLAGCRCQNEVRWLVDRLWAVSSFLPTFCFACLHRVFFFESLTFSIGSGF